MSGNNDAVILNEPTDGAPDKASGENIETLSHNSFLYAQHHRLNCFGNFVMCWVGRIFLFFCIELFFFSKMPTCRNEESISKA